MSRPIIRRLSHHVVDLIAAGEVVERPAAALKELVENALDAGATQIDIILREGGCDSIEVVDNGCGMAKEELSLAVERHCTSKLQNEDLVHIRTLGFRGEALPSIAATAKLSITSRIEDADCAWCLRVEGGVHHAITPAAGRIGTSVIVKDLFFATPARRKFLKTPRIESRHAESVVRRLALSAPHCAFHFQLDKRVVFSYPAQSLKERVAAILSVSSDILLELDEQRGDMRLSGFLCGPGHTCRTGSEQYILVNGRPVTDPILRTSIRVAYRNVIERGRFPILYLHLSVPFEKVDVNVHPAKTELRFSQENEVKSLLIGAVGRALSRGASEEGGVPVALHTVIKAHQKKECDALSEQGDFAKDEGGFGASIRSGFHYHTPSYRKASQNDESFIGVAELSAPYKVSDDIQKLFLSEDRQIQESPPILERAALEKKEEEKKEELKYSIGVLGVPIAQIHATYILSIGSDGDLILIDQHAAHERLTHEYLRTHIENGALIGQALLMPLVVDVSMREAELLKEAAEELKYLGLEVESFGEETMLLRTIPAILQGGDYATLLKDIAQELGEDPSLSIRQTESFDQRLEALIARIACHGSIRAGRILKQEEMNALLRDMEKYPRTNTCPHGRPTWLRLDRHALEKLFGRVK